jgi:hypothetical protein
MTTAAPGDLIRLRFAGNGHSRGFNAGGIGTPGEVSVYWKGAPEQEITDVSEFTQENLLATGGFAQDAFVIPADPSVTTPAEGLADFGNWLVRCAFLSSLNFANFLRSRCSYRLPCNLGDT